VGQHWVSKISVGGGEALPQWEESGMPKGKYKPKPKPKPKKLIGGVYTIPRKK
jgi:hypothetical protein